MMNLPAPSSPPSRSLLMYSHDGFGLGHLKRNFAIANKMVTDFPEWNALLLMGHSSVPFHPIPNGIDFVKLPSIIKIEDETWQPRSLSMNLEEFKAFRSSTIQHVAKHYKPNVFLVDYLPKGVWGELVPTLRELKTQSPETKIILGLRDIIDDPEKTKIRWQKGGYYEIIQEYYDHVLIYGTPEIFDTAREYGLQGDLLKKVSYCGYLCKGDPSKSAAAIRQELGIEDETFILVTAGGGGDAYPMMQLCMDTLNTLQTKQPILGVLITGPLMEPALVHHLEKEASKTGIRVLRSSHEILNYMHAADILITMASYNTMMEAVKLGKRTLVIPREGPSAEQKMRAKIFSEKGFISALPAAQYLTASALEAEILSAIQAPPFSRGLKMDGLQEACRRLMGDDSTYLPHPYFSDASTMEILH